MTPVITYKEKAWYDAFPEVTVKQYLVMAFLLSWQENGGIGGYEIGLRVLEDATGGGQRANKICRTLKKKGYVEEIDQEERYRWSPHPFHSKRQDFRIKRKWKLTQHGCLYLKNYPMPL